MTADPRLTAARSPGRRGAGWIPVFAILLAAACASIPPAATPDLGQAPRAEPAALAARWEAQWRAFPGLRAAVDLQVTRKGRTQRSPGILLLSPTHLRFEATAPLGLPLLIVTAGPEEVLVWSLAERRAFAARPTRQSMTRWLGLPLDPPVLIRLLVGLVPPAPDPASVRLVRDSKPHLAFEQGGVSHRVWATAEGAPVRVELQDGDRITVTFERNADGSLQGLAIEAPAQAVEARLRYIVAEVVAPPQDAFELKLPPQIRLEHVD